jgi:predicted DNA-binding transcriptional regulator YafY
MRGDRLARQWKILQMLSHAIDGISAAELAEKLGDSVRSIYRDLEALQKAGFPFYNCREGRASRWKLMAGFQGLTVIPLTIEELKALEVARTMINGSTKKTFCQALNCLIDKLHATLPPNKTKALKRFREDVRGSSK